MEAAEASIESLQMDETQPDAPMEAAEEIKLVPTTTLAFLQPIR